MRLRAASPDDAAAIAAIYAPFVTESAISFETEPPDEAAMRARIAAGGEFYPWLVTEEGGRVVGYAYAGPFRSRPAYRFAVETSLYLAHGAGGRGLGRTLYRALLEILERQGFVHAIAAITLPNPSSVRLHEDLRFARIGTYHQVGHKLGEWHDVGLWQRGLATAIGLPREPLRLEGVDGAHRP